MAFSRNTPVGSPAASRRISPPAISAVAWSRRPAPSPWRWQSSCGPCRASADGMFGRDPAERGVRRIALHVGRRRRWSISPDASRDRRSTCPGALRGCLGHQADDLVPDLACDRSSFRLDSPRPRKWPCPSMKPGIAIRPGQIDDLRLGADQRLDLRRLPTATITLPRTAIASTCGCLSSIVTIGPPRRTRSAGSAARAGVATSRSARVRSIV